MSLRRYSHGAGPLRVSVSANRPGTMYLLRKVSQRVCVQEEAWGNVENDGKAVKSKLLTDAANRHNRKTPYAVQLSHHVGWASRHNVGGILLTRARPLFSASPVRSFVLRLSSRSSAIWSWMIANAIETEDYVTARIRLTPLLSFLPRNSTELRGFLVFGRIVRRRLTGVNYRG